MVRRDSRDRHGRCGASNDEWFDIMVAFRHSFCLFVREVTPAFSHVRYRDPTVL